MALQFYQYQLVGRLSFRTQYSRNARGVHADRGLIVVIDAGEVLSVDDARAQYALERMTDESGAQVFAAVAPRVADVDYDQVLRERPDDPFLTRRGEPGRR